MVIADDMTEKPNLHVREMGFGNVDTNVITIKRRQEATKVIDMLLHGFGIHKEIIDKDGNAMC